MTSDDAATVLHCMLCGNGVRGTSKPWHFKCTECGFAVKPDDVGRLKTAIYRRLADLDIQVVAE